MWDMREKRWPILCWDMEGKGGRELCINCYGVKWQECGRCGEDCECGRNVGGVVRTVNVAGMWAVW